MPNETLVEFNLKAARKEPDRIRHADGRKPLHMVFCDNTACAKWYPDSNVHTYGPQGLNDFGNLRLVAKTRRVMQRAYRFISGPDIIHFASADETDLQRSVPHDWCNARWIDPTPFEREVPCE